MTHKIIKESEELFHIVEIASENVIGTYKNHDEAHQLYRRMKKKIGFEGFTPNFIIRSVKGYGSESTGS